MKILENSIFGISLPVLVIYFQLFDCYLHERFFLSFFLFCASNELGCNAPKYTLVVFDMFRVFCKPNLNVL